MANGDTVTTIVEKKNVPLAAYVFLLAGFGAWFLMDIGVIRLFSLLGHWLFMLILMIASLVVIGYRVTDGQRLAGALIDTRYRFSLSRLQVLLWTMLALSAFATIALPRLGGQINEETQAMKDACRQRVTDSAKANGTTDAVTLEALAGEQCMPTPLNITFPPELLLAMGISAASFAGSTLVQSNKKSKQVNVEAKKKEIDAADEALAKAETDLTNAKKAVEQKSDEVAELQDKLDAAKTELQTLEQGDLKTAREQAAKSLKDKVAVMDAQTAKVEAARQQVDAAATEADRTAAQQALADALSLNERAKRDVQTAVLARQDTDNKLAALAEAQANVKQLEDLKNNADKELDKAAKQQENAQKTLDEAQKKQQEVQDKYDKTEGLLHKNTSIKDANWSDLFRGEELGNFMLVEVSKVQMFFFTIVIVFAYGVAIAQLMQNAAALRHPYWVDLPAFSSTLNALLGISHGAYLSVKTVDHTQTS